MKHRYPNPFPGRPCPLPLTGLFLFSPEVDVKLRGGSLRGTFQAEGQESLFKCLERSTKLRIAPTEKLMSQLLTWMPGMPMRSDFAAAAKGDASAIQRIGELGPWEAYLSGRGAVSGEDESNCAQFIIDIERASAGVLASLLEQRFSDAAQALSSHPVLKPFVWPDALAAIAEAQSFEDLAALRASVALEVWLSYMAVLDTDAGWDAGENRCAQSVVRRLLPDLERTPTSQFFRYLKNRVGVRTISDFLGNPRMLDKKGALVDATTLKRWSSGAALPDPVTLRVLAKALLGNADDPGIHGHYMATRFVNFLGYFAQRMSGFVAKLAGTPEAAKVWPWPALPFGFATFEEWCQVRYPVWLEFHEHRLRERNRRGEGEAAPRRAATS